MRRVVWSEAARAEYRNILTYLAERNPSAAEIVGQRIKETIANLTDQPTGRPGRVFGTYEKVVLRTPYIIAYGLWEAPEGGETLNVLHVIHGARDWPEGRWPE